MIHRIDTPGDHDLTIEAGEITARDCAVEITAPDVTLRIDGWGLTRRDGDPQGDHDWPAFVRVAASAVRCRIVDSQLENIAGIAVDVYADDFEMLGTLATRFAAGVKLDGCARALIQDCALHTADKMLRLTEGGNDDTGANPLMVYNTPYDDQPTIVRRCYLGQARADSHDYGEDGASFEVWQSQSVTLEDCILLDSGTGIETGSKGTQVGNLIFRRCYIGNTQPADGVLVRGLMFRPVVDSLVEDCKFFDLDHWDVVVNQGSSSYAAGETENFRFTGNTHACTRNSQPYAVQPGPAPIIEEDLALFGDEAADLAAQLRGEAIAARDAILAGAGLKTDTDPGPVPSDLEARVAALEAGLAAEAETRAAADAALDTRLDDIATAAD